MGNKFEEKLKLGHEEQHIFDDEIYVLFDFINQDVVTKGTLEHIKNTLIELGKDNQWENIDEVYSLNVKEDISMWVYKNLDCYLQ